MNIAGAFFYLFSVMAILSGIMVVSARNPVHAVLFLILAFFNAAGLFVLMGAEFLAFTLVIVYVGAVAVLFLFVVMMLDIDFVMLRQGFLDYLPVGALVAALLLIEILLAIGVWTVAPESRILGSGDDISNAHALGRILYTEHVYYFQTAGLILLVAMIGAIMLTLHHKTGVRRQNVADQVARRPETAIELRKVKAGQGL